MGVIYPRGELKVITLLLVKGIQLELRASRDVGASKANCPNPRTGRTQETERELNRVSRDILRIIYLDTPLEAERPPIAGKCAYAEFC